MQITKQKNNNIMRGVFPKFIIEDGALVMMNVLYHSQIVNDKDKVTGGGWFRFHYPSKSCIFYGGSQDYGQAKLEHIKECVWNGKVFMNPPHPRTLVDKFNFYYDTGLEMIELQKKAAPVNTSILSFLFRVAGNFFYAPFKLLKKAS